MSIELSKTEQKRVGLALGEIFKVLDSKKESNTISGLLGSFPGDGEMKFTIEYKCEDQEKPNETKMSKSDLEDAVNKAIKKFEKEKFKDEDFYNQSLEFKKLFLKKSIRNIMEKLNPII